MITGVLKKAALSIFHNQNFHIFTVMLWTALNKFTIVMLHKGSDLFALI